MELNSIRDGKAKRYIAALLSTKGLDADKYGGVVWYLLNRSKWKRVGVSQFTLTDNFVERACKVLNLTSEELAAAIDDCVSVCLMIPVKNTYILNPEFFGAYDWKTVTDISYGISEGINFSHSYIGVNLEYNYGIPAEQSCLVHA